MAGMTASFNDNDANLWKKIAWNFYNYAVNKGISGLNPPSWNDNIDSLIKKSAYYTAIVL